jgi:hypothetical protein
MWNGFDSSYGLVMATSEYAGGSLGSTNGGYFIDKPGDFQLLMEHSDL